MNPEAVRSILKENNIPFKERIDEIKERVAAELQEAGFQINIKDLLS